MHLPLFPITLILRIIRKYCKPLPIGREGTFGQVSEILSAVTIYDLRFVLGEIVQQNSVRFALVVVVLEDDSTGFRVGTRHNTLKRVAIITTGDPALALPLTVFDLPLVADLFAEELYNPVAVGNVMKLAVVYESVRLKHNPFAFRRTALVPLPEVVLIQEFMFHNFLVSKESTKFWIRRWYIRAAGGGRDVIVWIGRWASPGDSNRGAVWEE
jgi:hypothetical protein